MESKLSRGGTGVEWGAITEGGFREYLYLTVSPAAKKLSEKGTGTLEF
jgi:hypothetical protein